MDLKDYAAEKIEVIQTLTRAGVISTTFLADLRIYKEYKNLGDKGTKTDRWAEVAENNKISEGKVRKVIKKMELEIDVQKRNTD